MKSRTSRIIQLAQSAWLRSSQHGRIARLTNRNENSFYSPTEVSPPGTNANRHPGDDESFKAISQSLKQSDHLSSHKHQQKNYLHQLSTTKNMPKNTQSAIRSSRRPPSGAWLAIAAYADALAPVAGQLLEAIGATASAIDQADKRLRTIEVDQD